ncbi:hypothetical protein KIK84_07415 [Curvibacter sp. CHRR-16]|uniref:hypothetical protein n=1 Tax=Curvibacter sp. CHRR-16 TaxID=2835872 RepID=UPI001BDA84AE|nr:hypothetical protein [Curvibacter sp. CHRR-16]MBT0570148.1 hypothetical protein [Curvibacter sp. CHRR-16]
MLVHASATAYCAVFVVGSLGFLGQANAQTPNLSAKAQKYQQMCQSAGGYFQTGTVNTPPNSDYPQVTNYKSGKKRNGIPLSHTHIEITSAIDGNVYDVAIDNVFANDYSPQKYSVPASYVKGIQGGANLYLCSGNPSQVPYSENEGMANQGFDWVHTNCAQSGYTGTFQNGFIYNDQGVNLTNSQTYCYLWPSK